MAWRRARTQSTLLFNIVMVMGLVELCLRLTTAQSLLDEQVCYIGDDLIRETGPGQVNITENLGKLYIMTSNPAPCDRIAVSVEVCASFRNLTSTVDVYALFISLFRYNSETVLYQQINARQIVDFKEIGRDYLCVNKSISLNKRWTVEKGDVLGVYVIDRCLTSNRDKTYCPAQPFIRPSQTTPLQEMLYFSETSDTLADFQLNSTQARINIRASIALTPPTIPKSCFKQKIPQPTPTCLPQTSKPQNDIPFGTVNKEPNAESSFWGGGVYILPEQVQFNGTAGYFSYCGFLNTRGSKTIHFSFILGHVRQNGIGYEVMNHMTVEVTNGAPAIANGNVNKTLHCDSDSINNKIGWEVQTGDQFAVYIFNVCESRNGNWICPVQVNLLNLDSCESTLFHPAASPERFIEKDDLLKVVPMSINVKIPITLSYSDLQQLQCDIPLSTPSLDDAAPLPVTDVATGITLSVFGVSMITLIVVVAVVLVRIRRRKKLLIKVSKETHKREISLSSTVRVEINERGIIRRTTVQDRSYQCEIQLSGSHSRLNDYSTIQCSPSMSVQDPLLPVYKKIRSKSSLYAHYETDDGDYTAPVFSPADMEEGLKQQLVALGIGEIPEDQLTFEEELGHGQFGTVYKALWHVTVNQDTSNPQTLAAGIAVKVMDNEMTTEDRIKFLQEAVLMGQFSDPNIVAVFGVVTISSQLMMLCELMDEDLRKHLTNIRTSIQNGTETGIDSTELPALLLSYCRKIASSFVYLGLKGFIHRDLAARNILVSQEGDCKIADFGMSRELQDDSYYKSHGGMVPVKWTSPEAILYKKYSTKSDVWSYGMLLYEIWSLGYKPYQGMTNTGVIAKVQTGYRLPPPPGCPRTIYDIMIKCTHPEPESRPTFTNVLVDLQRPDYQLLKWTQDDVATSSEAARTLGAPLDEGHCLYKDLQNTYMGSITNSIAI